MRMRQSLADLEQEFVEEAVNDRRRREHLRRKAATRSRERRRDRVRKHGTIRFVLLVFSLIATAVVVTVAMFETLAFLLG